MTENNISLFILELIKKTMQGKIEWQMIEPGGVSNKIYDDNIIGFIYRTEIMDKHFWLYKYKAKYYRDEYDWDWVEKIKLELIDSNGNSLYEFKYEYSLFDLYNAIREKTSGISSILDDLLKI